MWLSAFPTPWKRQGSIVVANNGYLVAKISTGDGVDDDMLAEIVVSAVNSHEALVPALKKANAALETLVDPEAVRTTTVANAWAQAVDAELATRKALALAGVKP